MKSAFISTQVLEQQNLEMKLLQTSIFFLVRSSIFLIKMIHLFLFKCASFTSLLCLLAEVLSVCMRTDDRPDVFSIIKESCTKHAVRERSVVQWQG